MILPARARVMSCVYTATVGRFLINGRVGGDKKIHMQPSRLVTGTSLLHGHIFKDDLALPDLKNVDSVCCRGWVAAKDDVGFAFYACAPLASENKTVVGSPSGACERSKRRLHTSLPHQHIKPNSHDHALHPNGDVCVLMRARQLNGFDYQRLPNRIGQRWIIHDCYRGASAGCRIKLPGRSNCAVTVGTTSCFPSTWPTFTPTTACTCWTPSRIPVAVPSTRARAMDARLLCK
jgi:hypothetical protein